MVIDYVYLLYICISFGLGFFIFYTHVCTQNLSTFLLVFKLFFFLISRKKPQEIKVILFLEETECTFLA